MVLGPALFRIITMFNFPAKQVAFLVEYEKPCKAAIWLPPKDFFDRHRLRLHVADTLGPTVW